MVNPYQDNEALEHTAPISKENQEKTIPQPLEKKETKKVSWRPKIGEFIKIKSINSKGKIISSDAIGQTYTVNCGSFNSTLSIADIEGLNGERPNINNFNIKIKSSKDNYSYSKVRTNRNTIDVRGLRVHEAEIIVEEKIRNFHGPLWIIHGIGTGKLKKGLNSWLSQLDYVNKLEDADPSEGGSGCTIAWIK